MSVDFFEINCKEHSRTEKEFGICDDQNGTKAYTDIADNTKWVAKVTNDNEIAVSFIAIDNCTTVLKEGTKEKESTCDGMLIFTESLFLVELKKQGKNWIEDAKRQLENTVKLIKANHDLFNIRFKKAFACNKKHPNFQILEASEQKAFFDRTGFRFHAGAEIVIKSK